jgi:hypothetical protein
MQQSPSSAAGVAAPLLQMAQGDQALVLVRPLARPPPVLCLRLGWPGDSAVEESPLPCDEWQSSMTAPLMDDSDLVINPLGPQKLCPASSPVVILRTLRVDMGFSDLHGEYR